MAPTRLGCFLLQYRHRAAPAAGAALVPTLRAGTRAVTLRFAASVPTRSAGTR
jgi:hypothetical protein